MSGSCKAQDVLVLLKLLTIAEEPWTFTRLAKSLGLSVGAAHNGLTHLRAAGLVYERAGAAVVARRRAADFLVHGVPAVFYPVRGIIEKGIPTGMSAPMLLKYAGASGAVDKAEIAIPVVWPSVTGKVRGETLLPIYATVPKAALADAALYELLALVDAVRIGRGKERRACADILISKVSAGDKGDGIAVSSATD